MGILTRLFGNVGTARFEFTTFDGQRGNGKVPFEALGYTTEELEEEFKKMLWVEKGVKVKTLRITGYYGT